MSELNHPQLTEQELAQYETLLKNAHVPDVKQTLERLNQRIKHPNPSVAEKTIFNVRNIVSAQKPDR